SQESIAYLPSSGLSSLSSQETIQKVRGEWCTRWCRWIRLHEIFLPEDGDGSGPWHFVEHPIWGHLRAVAAHAGEYLLQIGRDVEPLMDLCDWPPLLAKFRARQGHLEASLSEQGGAVHTVPLQAGHVKQPQGMARDEPGLDLLWEGRGIAGRVHCGSRMTRNG